MRALDTELNGIGLRITGLLQKYIDQKVDEETYAKTREALLNKQIELREVRNSLEKVDDKALDEMSKIGKLLRNPVNAYKIADPINKRRLIVSMVANLELVERKLAITWKKPFDLIAKRPFPSNGRLYGRKLERCYL